MDKNVLIKNGSLTTKQVNYLTHFRYFKDNYIAMLTSKGKYKSIIIFDFLDDKQRIFKKKIS